MRPVRLSGADSSSPAVSITVKSRSPSRASPSRRSRVTPGRSSTSATRRPTSRLNKVDLPTLGRPTMAMVKLMGMRSGPRISGRRSLGKPDRGVSARRCRAAARKARGRCSCSARRRLLRCRARPGRQFCCWPLPWPWAAGCMVTCVGGRVAVRGFGLRFGFGLGSAAGSIAAVFADGAGAAVLSLGVAAAAAGAGACAASGCG